MQHYFFLLYCLPAMIAAGASSLFCPVSPSLGLTPVTTASSSREGATSSYSYYCKAAKACRGNEIFRLDGEQDCRNCLSCVRRGLLWLVLTGGCAGRSLECRWCFRVIDSGLDGWLRGSKG